MLDTRDCGASLKALGFDFCAGVPCSFFKSFINYSIEHSTYISCANEGDAVATSAGAYLAGQKSMVLMQNSGLGNAISPITSLLHTYQIPLLLFISLRGEEGLQDEPQHELMGKITASLLKTMGIQHTVLSQDPSAMKVQLDLANQCIERGSSYAFIVKKGTFESYSLNKQKEPSCLPHTFAPSFSPAPIGSRRQALQSILKTLSFKHVLLSTTGKTSRELFELSDQAHHFYQVGSMGCISAIGLGIALSCPNLPVIVIDGDGAALMRLGSLATNGYYHPKNMCHILLDNQTHDSTGGQSTVASTVSFPQCAQALNYAQVYRISDLDALSHQLRAWHENPALSLFHIRIHPGSPKTLGRPTKTPAEVAQRFKTYIRSILK